MAVPLPFSGSEVFEMRGLLTKEECSQIVQSVEAQLGFRSLKGVYSATQRDATRACVLDPALADLIWSRVCASPATFLDRVRHRTPAGFGTRIPSCSTIATPASTTDRTDDKNSGWDAVGVNECFRISRYDAPSSGFAPHTDSPFCASWDRRSAFSLVFYLQCPSATNETNTKSLTATQIETTPKSVDVKVSGGTVFYDRPPEDAKCMPVPSGLTVKESLDATGGLDRYWKHTVGPETGLCLAFPHELLHAGAPLSAGSGCKIIMRTDLIFARSGRSQVPERPLSRLEDKAFQSCAEMFREAQNRELRGDVKAASDLYERVLSIRHSQRNDNGPSPSVAQSERSAKRLVMGAGSAAGGMMTSVMSYLALEDLAAAACTCRSLRANVASFERTAWLRVKQALDVDERSETPTVKHQDQQQDQRDDDSNVEDIEAAFWERFLGAVPDGPKLETLRHFGQHQVPLFINQVGSAAVFECDAEEFNRHPTAVLRVLAVLAVYHSAHHASWLKRSPIESEEFAQRAAEHFVAHYDPARGTVLRCPKLWMLACAFFELPCHGAFFLLPKTNANDIIRRSSACDPEILPDKEAVSDPESQADLKDEQLTVDEAFRTFVDGEMLLNQQLLPPKTELLRPERLFLRDFFGSRRTKVPLSPTSTTTGVVPRVTRGRSVKRRYSEVYKANERPVFRSFAHCPSMLVVKRVRRTFSGHDEGDGTEFEVTEEEEFTCGGDNSEQAYNNLIFDFAHSSIKVVSDKASPTRWTACFYDKPNGSAMWSEFNHASVQTRPLFSMTDVRFHKVRVKSVPIKLFPATASSKKLRFETFYTPDIAL